MPIVTEYKISGYTENGEPIIESTEKCLCPECKRGVLKPRGHVRRHIRKEDSGEKKWYWIQVGQCNNPDCKAMRRLLTDFMVPCKHYEEEAITDVLEEVITEESPVDCPSIQTMRRWIAWLLFNKERIEGIFRNTGYKILGFDEEFLFSTKSLLEQLRLRTDQWFKIMIRIVYNNGQRLLPL